MNVTTWQRRERRITHWGVDDFYHRPLREVYLFDFVTSRLELPRHGGSHSIKLALAGHEDYFIGKRTLRVRPGSFLVVNAGETYASRIRTQTHSLSMFYPDRDVAAAWSALDDSLPRALEPGSADTRAAGVPQFECRLSARSNGQIAALRGALRSRDKDAADEAAADLLTSTLGDLLGVAPTLALSQVRKAATRDELIGRVVRARDYVADRHGRDCPLDGLAQVACLSKFHFLRLFRQLFRESPAAFARRLRLEDAARALARGDAEDHAAAACGYASRHSLRRALGATRRAAQISNPC